MNLAAIATLREPIAWDYPAPLHAAVRVPVFVDESIDGLYVPGGLGKIQRSAVWGAALTTAGATLLKMSPTSGPAAPFVAAAAGVLMLGGQIVQMFKGCGATCIRASEIADDAASLLNQIHAEYFSTPKPRPRALQEEALAQIKQAFDYIAQYCGDPTLGDAGKRCVSERVVRGGTAPWCPNPGHTGCDYWTMYYDPIANDPDVVDEPDWWDAAGGNTFNLSGDAQQYLPVLLLGAALVALLLIL